MEQHRIKSKIGIHEFDGSGREEIVSAQYEKWLAAVAAHTVAAPLAPTPPADPGAPKPPPDSDAANPTLARAVLDRVFRQDDGFSLAALPRGDNAGPDAILALLYGALKMKGEATVTGTALMRAAKVSGVQNLGRLDRLMESITDFVLVAGVRKAKRYQLNNRGIARAEEVIKGIVQ